MKATKPAQGYEGADEAVCSSNDAQRPQFCPSSETPALQGPSEPCHGTAISGKLKVILQNHSIWLQFYREKTEMILTRQGRRMFPFLVYKIQGMDPAARYQVFLEIVPVDQYHWSYQYGQWYRCEKTKNVTGNRLYIHPDSPNTGAHWMKREIKFEKLKITNNKEICKNGNQFIVLQSLHKYQPRLGIEEVRHGEHETPASSSKHSFIFPETEFITVTAYQNAKISKLKINYNCFAKGFRGSYYAGETMNKCTASAESNTMTITSETDSSGFIKKSEKRARLDMEETPLNLQATQLPFVNADSTPQGSIPVSLDRNGMDHGFLPSTSPPNITFSPGQDAVTPLNPQATQLPFVNADSTPQGSIPVSLDRSGMDHGFLPSTSPPNITFSPGQDAVTPLNPQATQLPFVNADSTPQGSIPVSLDRSGMDHGFLPSTSPPNITFSPGQDAVTPLNPQATQLPFVNADSTPQGSIPVSLDRSGMDHGFLPSTSPPNITFSPGQDAVTPLNPQATQLPFVNADSTPQGSIPVSLDRSGMDHGFLPSTSPPNITFSPGQDAVTPLNPQATQLPFVNADSTPQGSIPVSLDRSGMHHGFLPSTSPPNVIFSPGQDAVTPLNPQATQIPFVNADSTPQGSIPVSLDRSGMHHGFLPSTSPPNVIFSPGQDAVTPLNPQATQLPFVNADSTPQGSIPVSLDRSGMHHGFLPSTSPPNITFSLGQNSVTHERDWPTYHHIQTSLVTDGSSICPQTSQTVPLLFRKMNRLEKDSRSLNSGVRIQSSLKMLLLHTVRVPTSYLSRQG